MKTYSKPELYIEDLQTIDMLALSIKGGEADGGEVLNNGRRGSWGNLWAEEE
jgi:hypothetical protein